MNLPHRATHECIEQFIRRQNIIHFHKLLAIETDQAKRKVLRELLAEQEEMQRAVGDLTVAAVSRPAPFLTLETRPALVAT